MDAFSAYEQGLEELLKWKGCSVLKSYSSEYVFFRQDEQDLQDFALFLSC